MLVWRPVLFIDEDNLGTPDARNMTEPPQWNSEEPGASLLAYAEFLHGEARNVFERDGSHVEILFILADGGTIQPQPIAEPMSREHVSECLREQIPGSNIYGLIHIAEAWSYNAKGSADHTFKQLKLGEMRVSDLVDEDRSEMLVVSLLSRDGDKFAWIDKVVRTASNEVSLEESRKLAGTQFPFGDVFRG